MENIYKIHMLAVGFEPPTLGVLGMVITLSRRSSVHKSTVGIVEWVKVKVGIWIAHSSHKLN